MKKLIILIFFVLICNTGFCAGPITHAYLADRFFETFPKYNENEKKVFMAGTLFPDIRYLGVIKREATHFPSVSLEEILEEESPFVAGMKFHSFVDLQREQFRQSYGDYSLLEQLQMPHKSVFLKFLEDEIIYPKAPWTHWNKTLQQIPMEERTWNIDFATLQKWHFLLQLFFLAPPSSIISFASTTEGVDILGGNVSAEELNAWESQIVILSCSEIVNDYVEDMLSYFDLLFKEFQTSLN